MGVTMDIKEVMDKLQEPFSYHDLEFMPQTFAESKSGTKALMLAYVSARAGFDRLDSVVGTNNWQDKYERWGETSVKCMLGVKLDDEWIWKEDGAEDTEIEAIKGGFSSAFKRACVKWGMGRYLYKLPNLWCDFVESVPYNDNINNYIRVKNNKTNVWGFVKKPTLPDFALPENERSKSSNCQAEQQVQQESQEKVAPVTKPKSNGITQQQIMAIQKSIATAQRLNIPVNLDKILAKVNKSNIGELTFEQATKLIAKLSKTISENGKKKSGSGE